MPCVLLIPFLICGCSVGVRSFRKEISPGAAEAPSPSLPLPSHEQGAVPELPRPGEARVIQAALSHRRSPASPGTSSGAAGQS